MSPPDDERNRAPTTQARHGFERPGWFSRADAGVARPAADGEAPVAEAGAAAALAWAVAPKPCVPRDGSVSHKDLAS